jgi:catechol 2,3-dioxygenase-like lactoylglutathione lyase family enzyme
VAVPNGPGRPDEDVSILSTVVRGVKTLGHVGVTVPDLDVAVEFFCVVLRFRLVSRHELVTPVADPEAWFRLPPRTTAKFAFLELGSETLLELVEWKDSQGNQRSTGLADNGGVHVAIWVEDLEAALSDLGAVPGVEVFEPRQGWFGYARTPWGLHVQLMAPWPDESRRDG